MKKCTTIALILFASIAIAGCSKDSPTDVQIPTAISSPWPADAANGVSTSFTLSWSCSGTDAGDQVYDLYLSTVNPPAVAIAVGQSPTTFSCTGLAVSTVYYWKVDAIDGRGTVTNSPVWSFTTGSGVYSPGMVTVEGGTFVPRGTVTLTIGEFSMDKYEVTYELWTDVRSWGSTNGYTDLVAGQNGVNPIGANNPVTLVNWYDMVKWCNARSEMDDLTPVYYTNNTQGAVYRTGELDINIDAVNWNADGYRLPTEAEWEFAARGGNDSRGYTFSGGNIADNVAWYAGNSVNSTNPVGAKSANELGIYDMSGNILEGCWDWLFAWDEFPYGGTTDPKGPSTAQTYRITRGGFFSGEEITCNVATRSYNANGPSHRAAIIGFRCVRD